LHLTSGHSDALGPSIQEATMNRRDFVFKCGGAAVFTFTALSHSRARAQAARALEVREADLVARFYTPANARALTSVLMLGGSGGGFANPDAASDLAAAGFPTLALAYFQGRNGQPGGLPSALAEIPLEYVFGALDWLGGRPEVRRDRVVIMGESRGAELALLVASHRPDLAGAIAFSPSEVAWSALQPGPPRPSWTLKGAPVPFLSPAFQPGGSMAGSFAAALDSPGQARAAAEIAVEAINGPVLLFSTTADGIWPSARMAADLAARARARRFAHPLSSRTFDDASHLLMGYGPAPTRIDYPGFTLLLGGTPEGTLKARTAAWTQTKAMLTSL
jgi:dienelactone hydrolase